MATKTVTLNGAEQRIDGLGGLNALIVNNTNEPLYASAKAGIVPYADGVIEIKAGASRGLPDTNGTVYLLGSGGRAELTGTSASVNFNVPSSSSEGGGKESLMPVMIGMTGYFAAENADIEHGLWKNIISGGNDMELHNAALSGSTVYFSKFAYGEFQTITVPNVIYLAVRMNDIPSSSSVASVVMSKGITGTAEKYSRALLFNVNNGQTLSCGWSGHGVYSYVTDLQKYHIIVISVKDDNNAELYNQIMALPTDKED